ncbi:MAG: carboxypeptidase regulatory-like domain-containing protein [Sedimentisphaerales bacterium]|nr:carboxypeptidase regulatory-like domain-containing protein [Sedimentisphaerales bacterium]
MFTNIKFPLIYTLVIAISIVCFAAEQNSSKEAVQSDSEQATTSEKSLDVHIINRATKQPLPDVNLEIRINVEDGENVKSWEDKTDARGHCTIPLPEMQIKTFRIYPRKEGFVPLFILWSNESVPLIIPPVLNVSMEPCTTIGGVIQNEQGEPIEGVAVGVHYQTTDPDAAENVRVDVMIHNAHQTDIKTDAMGKWSFDKMPANIDKNELRIFLTHPDYMSDNLIRGYIPMPLTPQPAMAALRDLSSVMAMKKGITVSGRVLDTNNNPIEGASIVSGSERFGADNPDTKTDGEGRFVYKNAQPGEMVLTVKAPGHSPDLKQVVVKKDMPVIEFRLEKGRTIKGRIIDNTGKPIAKASVGADTWRGHRSLQWRVETDADGRFVWNEAPSDEVLIDMYKRNYMSVRDYGMRASDKEYVITMYPELKVHGKVTDQQTGRPIPDFQLMPGIDWGNGRAVYWERRNQKAFTDGKYETSFTYPREAHFIRVEAEGYEPGISRPFMSNEGEVVFDFKLKKGTGPTGIVRLGDGKIAQGAEVILCTPSQNLYLSNGQNRERRNSQYVETKQDGKFSFPVQTDPYIIVVLHDDGYAQVTDDEFKASSEITLQPWAKVRGKLMVGTEPGANISMRLLFDRPDEAGGIRFYHDYNTTTDNNGNFVFERVAPGNARVCREVRLSENVITFSHSVPLEIKSGQTSDVTIGGTGRPVTGKIVIPDYLKDIFQWQNCDHFLRINSPDNPYKQLGFKIEDDGSFRIEDVPAGDYSMNFNAYAPPPDSRSFRGERIGELSQSFNVPEMEGGRSDEPVELGILQLEAVNKSAFTPSLLGKDLQELKDFDIELSNSDTEAKMILICFFDMQQRPSRNCIMQLNKRAQELKAKDIVIVAIQASKIEQEQLNEWIKDQNVTLPVGIISSGNEMMRFNWGVKSLPWLILTDSKHVVTAEGFSISELDEKLK